MNTTFVTLGALLVLKFACTSDVKQNLEEVQEAVDSIECEVQRFISIFEDYIVEQSNPRKKIKRSKSDYGSKENKECADKDSSVESQLNVEGLGDKDDEEVKFDFVPKVEMEPFQKVKDEQSKSEYASEYGSECHKSDSVKSKKHGSPKANVERRSRSLTRRGNRRKRAKGSESSSEGRIPTKSRYREYRYEEKDNKYDPEKEEDEDLDDEISKLTSNLSKTTIDDENKLATRKFRSSSEDRYNRRVYGDIGDVSDEDTNDCQKDDDDIHCIKFKSL